MIQHLFRMVAALAVVATSFVALAPVPVLAAPGDSPTEAIPIDNNTDFTFFGALPAGRVRWYRVYNPGNGVPLGITFHLRSQDVVNSSAIETVVNIRTPAENSLGEPNKDVQGYNRIGAIAKTDNTGDNRRFWLNFEGNVQPYYLKVGNYTGGAISFGMTVRRNDQPAPWVQAPDPSQITDSAAAVPPAAATTAPAAPAAPVATPVAPATPLTPATPAPTQPRPAPTVAAGTGSSPDQAQFVDILRADEITEQGTIQPGERYWVKVEYPGDNKPLGVTLHLNRGEDPAVNRNVNVLVNVRTREDTLGENNVDFRNLTRIGRLNPINDGEPHYKFWTAVSGARETYFFVIQNFAPKPVTVALTFNREEKPASYFVPTGQPAAQPAAPTTPAGAPPEDPTAPAEPATPAEPVAPAVPTTPAEPVAPAPSIADVVLGTTPLQAELVALTNVTKQGRLIAGTDYWYRIEYPGDNQPVGVTIHLPQDEDAAVLQAVTGYVNVRMAEGAQGEAGADWPGFDRLGQTTGVGGQARQFWTATSGDRQTYYIRVRNGSAKDVPYVITFTRDGDPAAYAPPVMGGA